MNLSPSEKMLIARRRLGLSQRAASERAAWPFRAYVAAERGQRDLAVQEDITNLSDGEILLIERRRRDWTQGWLALMVGCSRYQINKMEHGQADCAVALKVVREL